MMLLTLEKASLGYPGKLILENVDLAIERGAFFGIVGPNGCGKSTLVKTMLGLIPPRSGHLHWPEGKPAIGYVPQREQVDPFWPMRVRDILQYTVCSLDPPHFFPKKEHVKVEHAMRATAIEHLADQNLDTLSGGEMQRLLLARALAVDPRVLFLDEPTAAMDILAAERFMDMISGLHREQNITVIIVTHDLHTLAGRADLIAIMEKGQLYYDTPEHLLTSETLSRIYDHPVIVNRVEGQLVIRGGPTGMETTK